MSSLLPRENGALPPPDGVISNYTNPQNWSTEIYMVTGFCISIVTVLVSLRTYTRFFIIKHRGWQDYLLLLAWFFSLLYLVIALSPGIKYEIGIHRGDVIEPNITKLLQIKNIQMIIYSCAICLVKLVILIQLAHIFTPFKSRMYWALCTISAVTAILYVTCIISAILQCIPREKIWKPSIPGKCINAKTGIIASGVVNTLSDFVLFILPLSMIRQLQMPTRKKLAVSAVFSTGLFCISSIIRLVVSVDVSRSRDPLYRILTMVYWTDAEITSGIICCCLPVLPKFYRTHVSGFVTSLRNRLISYAVSPISASNGLGGDSSGSREPKNMRDGQFHQTAHPYVELKRPMIGKDDLTIPGDSEKVFSKTENINIGNGVWDEDVEMGKIRTTKSIQMESHIV